MATKLASLGTPTWGERLVLARRRKGINLEEVARRVSDIAPISYGTLVRFEKMTEPPTDKKRRFIAFLVLLACGYDPTNFGLSADDVPKGITTERLSELVDSWTQWSTALGGNAMVA